VKRERDGKRGNGKVREKKIKGSRRKCKPWVTFASISIWMIS
jgi:hypothetical protein